MIIQCKQCRTKFRFDESQMEGDGLWMRCSRCQHVFFQDNPARVKPASDDVSPSDEKTPDGEPERPVRRPSFEPAEKSAGAVSHDEDMQSFMKEVIGDKKTDVAEVGDDAEVADAARVSSPLHEPKHDDLRLADIDLPEAPAAPVSRDEEPDAETPPEPEPVAKKKSGAWKVLLWAVLVIAVIPAVVYFVIFPDLGERYVQIARKYLGGASESTEGPAVMGQIKIQNVRQRIVNNFILGNIRIVEGTAVNQSDFPVSRVRVKGELLDAYAVALGERTSYAGNILTEEELTNMSEDDILKRLSRPEGRNNINERVLPNGRIPFMIVFTREPPGAIKTTVMVSGAERLL